VRKELALIWYCSPHQYCELRQAPHEALVVVCAVVVSGLVKAFEAPAIQLTRERFVFSLHEICGYDLLYKEVLVVHLPCPAFKDGIEQKDVQYGRNLVSAFVKHVHQATMTKKPYRVAVKYGKHESLIGRQ
jgi:hypothetical protein